MSTSSFPTYNSTTTSNSQVSKQVTSDLTANADNNQEANINSSSCTNSSSANSSSTSSSYPVVTSTRVQQILIQDQANAKTNTQKQQQDNLTTQQLSDNQQLKPSFEQVHPSGKAIKQYTSSQDTYVQMPHAASNQESFRQQFYRQNEQESQEEFDASLEDQVNPTSKHEVGVTVDLNPAKVPVINTPLNQQQIHLKQQRLAARNSNLENTSNINADQQDSAATASTTNNSTLAATKTTSVNSTSSYDVVTPHQRALQSKLPSAYFMVILLSIVSITPGLANTSFNPAIMEVASHYHVSLEKIQALSATYFLGLGCGQLIWGPLTDRFGRRKSIFACTILACLINFLFINTQTYAQLQTARFFQGVIFSCFGLLPTAVLRDSYSARNFIIYNSWVMILFLLAPAFAPLFGGYILISLGWQCIFTILSAICVVGLLFYWMKIPETLDPSRRQPINPLKILKNYYTILSNLKSLLCLLLGGLLAVVIFAWTALCSALLINDYHIAPQNIGYYSIFPVIFTIIANKLNGSLVKKYNPQQILVTSTLIQTIFSVINLIVAWYFLGAIGLVVAQTLNALFTGFQNANLVSIYLMDYSHMVGTASSLFLSLRTIIPSILIFAISFAPRNMGTTFLYFDGAVIVFSFLVVLLFNRLYPAPGARMHKLRMKAIKYHKRQMQARFGNAQ
ncbi:multidrug effflux MFS transporter [Psittacicella hinzii]|uniref:Major facilitator superfamily (MFS) profile domain-containing protein n=1 Tax=Psittacicella hinzii TaxID=2028575 RepID=A0A3A1YFR8_9GAMM|nr:multidrug effflux MFS transporter [Psittacicella hinzii]RIY37093.1 hypothetical protein CKF58_05375 [Psittacicella hinzii]